MKKTFLLALMSCASMPLWAQEEMVEEHLSERVSNAPDLLSLILAILCCIAILAAFGHMIYIFFFQEKKIAPITLDQIREARIAAGKDPEASDEEYSQTLDLINGIYDDCFTKFRDNQGEERGIPTKHKQMVAMRARMAEVYATLPTDDEIIDQYNHYAEIFNDCQKRIFAGSKVMLWIVGILAAVMAYCGAPEGVPFLIFSGVMYWFSCKKSQFRFYEDELKGKTPGTGFMNTVLGVFFGAVATAKTYKTVTKWSDGSTTTDTDDSETWISLLFAIFVVLLLICFLTIISLINYLRNYVLYW